MNELGQIHEAREKEILAIKEKVLAAREAAGFVPATRYLLPMLADMLGIEGAKLEFIDRAMFGADVALTVPHLLRKGSKEYIKEVVPALVEEIRNRDVTPPGAIVSVEAKGLYINIRLSDIFLFGTTVAALEKLKTQYGALDAHKGESVVVDYSSPNVAKHLHAGHIRSTIIGHVLANVYQAVGYTVHRVNHINDWGGVGFLLEGYARWSNFESEYENKNDFLYFLYTKYRQLEKEAEESESRLDSARQAAKKEYEQFATASRERFIRLEAGEQTEVTLWQQMVGWSLADFNTFYDLINIHADYTVGESFYVRRGVDLVERGLAAGSVTIEDGAAVVHVGEEDDFVIRRSDESTIYATRDLAAIEHRLVTFTPARMVYVVGQEQTDYFRKLFAAARLLGLASHSVSLEHVPFGFYTHALTKKKLASREGAQNVVALIRAAVSYFKEKYSDLSDGDAKKIAIGSIAFNDIKKDRMMPVELDPDTRKTIELFESSGGAYIMYAVARARSIVRKSDMPVPAMADIAEAGLFPPAGGLAPAEIALIKKLAAFSDAIVRAGQTNNPSVLAEYLERLAQDYNSYYESFPVLKDGKPEHPHRLVLTNAIAQVLVNGLALCHMEVPERM